MILDCFNPKFGHQQLSAALSLLQYTYKYAQESLADHGCECHTMNAILVVLPLVHQARL